MQRFILIAGLAALFMYAGFVAEGQQATAPPPKADLAGLQQALSAANADIHTVLITGWVRVTRPVAQDTLSATLGWASGAVPREEVRDLRRYQRDGVSYVGVRWVMAGTGLTGWQARVARVRAALAAAGPDPMMTVQLEGTTPRSDFLPLENQALDAVHATDRQPWSDGKAASIAGHTKALPPGPFGVNVQVAARKDGADGRTRVWVAWPALQQEY
ncbi:MAG TPA: YwmB family TATA-box binding protein [Symbiobacteriaceae bacterium]|jgi:hypothetical protein